MKFQAKVFGLISLIIIISSCNETDNTQKEDIQYSTVEISPNLDDLNENQKKVIYFLIKAAKQADDIYWKQTYGEKNELFYKIRNEDQQIKDLVTANYGPWDIFNENKPIIDGFDVRPIGNNLYPKHFTREDFLSLKDTNKYSNFTVIKEVDKNEFIVVPYFTEYRQNLIQAINYIQKAANICENASFSNYLNALISDIKKDNYNDSFKAWMQVSNYPIDFLFGPLEKFSNEDGFMYIKSIYASVLIKPIEKWNSKTDSILKTMTYLHSCLPIGENTRTVIPSISTNELGVYEIIVCTGKWNSGAKEISMYMPQDPAFHLKYGSKKLLFDNAARSKYNLILKPIGDKLLANNQQKFINYQSFVENLIFGDISNGLDIKETASGENVQTKLKDTYAVIKIASSQISSQYLVYKYNDVTEKDIKKTMNNYVTFLCNILRTIRFGVTNSYTRANILIFNLLKENGAIEYNADERAYSINYEKMKLQSLKISEELLRIQSEGDYDGAKKLISEKGYIQDETIIDLYYLSNNNIPKDISYNQKMLK